MQKQEFLAKTSDLQSTDRKLAEFNTGERLSFGPVRYPASSASIRSGWI